MGAGSLTVRVRLLASVCVAGTMNGSGLSSTNLRMPWAMRRMVASARGFLRSKMLLPWMLQSMHSDMGRQACCPALGFLAWVRAGQTMGRPSHRATI